MIERLAGLANSAAAAYTLPLLAAALVNFSGGYRQAMERLEPAGVALFDVPYELATPTRTLIEDSFGDSIRRFDDRPLILLMGNSVIQGAGSVQRLHLSRLLAAERNVINAAVGGEHLSSSAVLGLYGLKLAVAGRKPPRVDVFVAYPASRFYMDDKFGVYEGAAAELCKAYALDAYIPACALAKQAGTFERAARSLGDPFLVRARCLTTQHDFFSSLRYGSYACLRLFEDERRSPGFVEEYRNKATLKSLDREAAVTALRVMRQAFSPVILPHTIRQTRTYMRAIAAYLAEQGVPFSLHLIFLQESPELLSRLSPQERDEFRSAAVLLGQGVVEALPGVQAELWSGFKPEDYFDPVHFNERGQSKIAALILDRSRAPLPPLPVKQRRKVPLSVFHGAAGLRVGASVEVTVGRQKVIGTIVKIGAKEVEFEF